MGAFKRSPGCKCCVKKTPCSPCDLPFTTETILATLAYRGWGVSASRVSKTLTWFPASQIWCAANPNPALGCVFTLNDYDGSGWLLDNNNQPCFSAVNNYATNHVFQVSCTNGSIQVKHLVYCASGAPGRTYTFFVSSYTSVTFHCSTTPGGTTMRLARVPTSSNPDNSMDLTW